jgi:hypothetical protein
VIFHYAAFRACFMLDKILAMTATRSEIPAS